MQKLQLEIRHICILKGMGADQISFFVPNNNVLDKVLGNTKARECFSELTFDLKITKNKSEDLLSALGLTADEIIDTTRDNYKFGQQHNGETNAGS